MTIYNAIIWDSSCHVYTTVDLGVTWITNSTPDPVNGDDWNDFAMATNAGDYVTMVGFDNTYLLDSTQSATGFSPSTGETGSWTLGFPNVTASNNQQFYSGAITSGAAKILALPAYWTGNEAINFPRISTDQGATWSNLSVPSGRNWNLACTDATGQIMYMTWVSNSGMFLGGITKSTNGGTTWNDLAASSVMKHFYFINGCQQRMRCSANGQVFCCTDIDSQPGNAFGIYISTDGGGTIAVLNSDNFPDEFGIGADAGAEVSDCAVSNDGSVIIVGLGAVIGFDPSDYLFISKDSGSTWENLSPPNIGNFLRTCCLSPDGRCIVVCYQVTQDVGNYLVDISTDQGVTWTSSVLVPVPNLSPVASYVVPVGSPAPPFPPFGPGSGAQKGGYIIERLDNRIWPTVENAWCVDCGFTLHRPTPAADMVASSAAGAGIPTGVTDLVGGEGYSSATTAQLIDGNGLGPGTGAVVGLTIVAGVITAITFTGGSGYIYPNLSFSDPTNSGSGASATVTLNNSATFAASAAVFSSGDVGSVIRAGYGVATITAFTDAQTVTANLTSPIVQVQPDNPIDPNVSLIFANGTWTMTEPISQFYLPQLVGFEITGLADGQIIPPTIVPANGLVTLAQPASAIIVGLAFQAQLQSTYLDAGEPTVQGQRKKIAAVTVRVEQSAAFQIGGNQPDGSVQSPQVLAPPWQNMVDAPTHAVAPFNAPFTPLFTGDTRVTIPGGFNTRGQVAVQQLNPLPLQVLDYSEEILGGDEPAQKAPPRQKGKGGGAG